MEQQKPLLSVEGLHIGFDRYGKGLHRTHLEVISDLSLDVARGRMVAVVGSSGSGKSLLAHAVMGILPGNAQVSGTISFDGEPLTPESQAQLRGSRIAFIPQAVTYLDPLMKVGAQVAGVRAETADAERVMASFGLEASVGSLYPFELSGGMARRVLVSTALVEDADLIIADEPTPGMTHDMAVAALQDFRKFADQGKGVVLITHDLDLAYEVADTVVVFYAGQTLEVADAADFRKGPEALRHPYSKALWKALPQNGFEPLAGTQPYPDNLPTGCRFASRCSLCEADCEAGTVSLRDVRGGEVRCCHAS